ncbi:hypothetical protein FXO38_14607 [Capsicum annuum]|nr:hypothetical protein FXO38_14607 [Capsicum annuum]
MERNVASPKGKYELAIEPSYPVKSGPNPPNSGPSLPTPVKPPTIYLAIFGLNSGENGEGKRLPRWRLWAIPPVAAEVAVEGGFARNIEKSKAAPVGSGMELAGHHFWRDSSGKRGKEEVSMVVVLETLVVRWSASVTAGGTLEREERR